jgi:streptogramin lyase
MRLRRTTIAASLFAASSLLGYGADAQTKKFTTSADFDTGTLNNVVHIPANQIVLGPTPVSKTNIVWSTNYLYGYVVRLDTLTGKQTGRFDSALVSINGNATGARPAQEYCDFSTTGNCPGRVAVDTNGDVWIVNRAFGHQGTLSKFSGNIAHCIDRNNNGVIDTSFDKNNDGVIDVNPAAGEYFGQNDECILTTIPIGPNNVYPRGVAVDKYGKIWVSTFNDGKVYRYNPNEPVALEATVTVGGNPYSLATGNDYLFISKANTTGPTTRVNITTLGVSNIATAGQGTYGVVADPGGNVAWFGGWFGAGSGLFKADYAANTFTNYAAPGSNITAVTLDLAGNVWACGYNNSSVYKYNSSGVLLGQYPAGGGSPHGMSIDFQGNLWVVTHTPPQMVKINVNTGAIIGQYTIAGPGIPNADPYLYSDFTGTQIDRQAPYTYVGSWDGVFDGQVPNLGWSKVGWNSEPQGAVPALSSLVVSARAANTIPALGAAAYTPVTNGGVVAGVKGRYVQVRTDLKGPGFVTSVLSDITVTGPCPTLGDACCVVDSDCADANVCTLDTCPTPGGACVHTMQASCCITPADCNDQNACTTDSCPVPGGACAHAGIAGCCNSGADCSDGNLCTADVCSGPGGTCTHPIINGCCNVDADCTMGNLCSSATCPVPGGFCVGGAIPGCCATDADCADTNLCTADKCDVATKTCTNTLVPGCCNVDGDCNDSDTCTTDTCSGKGGTCVYSATPGCCTPNDPKVGTPCDLPVSPHDKLPCKPGTLSCVSGKFQCDGAVKPGIEICDNIDNDCDGVADSPPPCPLGTTCFDGVCAKPCGQGEFVCPSDEQCVGGYCVPTSCDKVVCPEGQTCANGLCTGGDGGAPATTTTSSGASTASAAASSSAGSGAGGDTGAGGAAMTTASSTAASSTSSGFFGLPSGGGGCRCSTPGSTTENESLGGAALALVGLASALIRRRRGEKGTR